MIGLAILGLISIVIVAILLQHIAQDAYNDGETSASIAAFVISIMLLAVSFALAIKYF